MSLASFRYSIISFMAAMFVYRLQSLIYSGEWTMAVTVSLYWAQCSVRRGWGLTHSIDSRDWVLRVSVSMAGRLEGFPGLGTLELPGWCLLLLWSTGVTRLPRRTLLEYSFPPIIISDCNTLSSVTHYCCSQAKPPFLCTRGNDSLSSVSHY